MANHQKLVDFETLCIQELHRQCLPPGPLRLRYTPKWPTLMLHLEGGDIEQENFPACLKLTYTGHIDKLRQATTRGESESEIANDCCEAMISLHRTLFHEHHDSFQARHHASAPELNSLALKYSMPASMWRHGIQMYLELFQHRSPDSFEYMLAFIYLAYQLAILSEIWAHTRIGGLFSEWKETQSTECHSHLCKSLYMTTQLICLNRGKASRSRATKKTRSRCQRTRSTSSSERSHRKSCEEP